MGKFVHWALFIDVNSVVTSGTARLPNSLDFARSRWSVSGYSCSHLFALPHKLNASNRVPLDPLFISLESFVTLIFTTSTIPSLSKPPSLSNEESPSLLLGAKAVSAFMRVSKLKYFIFYAWSAFEVYSHHSHLHSCRRIVVFTSVPLATELPARSAIYQGRPYGKSHFALVQRP